MYLGLCNSKRDDFVVDSARLAVSSEHDKSDDIVESPREGARVQGTGLLRSAMPVVDS